MSGSAGCGAADDRDEVAAALAGSGHEDDRIRLEDFSDDVLELELVRRRRHRDSRAKPGEGSVAACGPLEGGCTGDGGACLPCFEIA